ncbi:phosphoserine phosphatase [Neoasaia chiangmaiensis NBRC 101099]|uniref:Phosphoserine phosphatase n=1 Tax=Neoasaia chiangmaiensis TaxID=320497 RepID=A0A1U9KSP6_9PROT|nr:phosphoserine phosphatase SerB [Neoasaia chiangmaiensis]AQS88747.1 phosphoserine phosphatase [Neoasaia chiangmaiensis]GBR40866.1 phosphoserine phosphatase [Neoasaia chiangmaiensis NBRC 101099]GEN13707.1 phosphoserine phosphatase SerB [Neoasaia chiangmaiensis]
MTLPYVLTLVANRENGTLPTAVIDVARNMVKGAKPNILSPGEAVDIPCPAPGAGSPSAATLRASFARHQVDALLLKSRGRRKAVLVADMDSTILKNETLDDLADLLGCGDEVRRITEASMNGEMDFDAALQARVALLKGKNADTLKKVLEKLVIQDGAKTLVQTMKAHNARTALVSGGFTYFTHHVAAACGFDEHHGNELAIRNGVLTGELAAPILGPNAKLQHLERLAAERGVKLGATLTTGDGANDLPMLRAAGLGIAYHAKPHVREEIVTQVNHAGLRAHLFAQGYPAQAFVS